LAANTRPVSVLAEPDEMRAMLNQMAKKLDGTRAAASVVKRKRAVHYKVVEYAVEKELLPSNPIPALKWKTPKLVKAIDKRCVVNPQQGPALLDAVGAQQPSGPRLKAFFGCMYYSGLRPAEAANLRKDNVVLPGLVRNGETQEWEEPEDNWGEFLLSESAPETGASWSGTGKRCDRRELKHRTVGEVRPVPIPPPLTTLLRDHMAAFPPDADGNIFYGTRGGQISESTYSQAWRQARKDALTEAEYASPLARRAYDLRHACVSTQLNAGVPPTQVAEWAGHSLAMLYQIYAKCLVGQEHLARRRIEEALRQDSDSDAGE
jgi:integrase